ncbi:hypothetical protein DY000_02040041 [Brassica cretica]|uniref:Uncharacterized protein n=1 Tax=Brassica cretica TaxID=69181 RepID=A0ABQ7BPP4_BRACR|nr:hypothetical protein DY000_02040041 [Brassica cretica]
MEDFLELEDFLKVLDEAQFEDLGKDSEQKLEDNHHTSGRDMETSPKASIDRHPSESIDRHPHDYNNRHPPDDIDQHAGLDELSGYIVELEPIEERMYKFEASHLDVPTHRRPNISQEKLLVESPIPPDISVHQDLKIGIVEGYLPVVVFQEKLGLDDDVRKVSATPASTPFGKYIVHSRCFAQPFSKL